MKLTNTQMIVLLIAGAAIIIYLFKKNKDKESSFRRTKFRANPLKECVNRCLATGKPMEYCISYCTGGQDTPPPTPTVEL